MARLRAARSFCLAPALVVAVALVVLPGTGPAQGLTLPPVTLPPVTVPGVTVPDVTLPVTVPTVPGAQPVLDAVESLLTTSVTVPGGVLPSGLYQCIHFLTQDAAQLALDANALQAALLDPDGDGRACTQLPAGPATDAAAVAAAASKAGTSPTGGTGSGGTMSGGNGSNTGGGTDGSGSTATGASARSAGSAGLGGAVAAGSNAAVADAGDSKAKNSPWLAFLAVAVLALIVGGTAVFSARRSRG